MNNIAIIRGTTPTVQVTLENYDVSKLATIHLALKQQKTLLIKNETQMRIDPISNTISIPLSQADTLMFQGGEVEAQLRMSNLWDDYLGTIVMSIPWYKTLEEGRI